VPTHNCAEFIPELLARLTHRSPLRR
jgi:hypothetical protein